jgi:hypothetical protein
MISTHPPLQSQGVIFVRAMFSPDSMNGVVQAKRRRRSVRTAGLKPARFVATVEFASTRIPNTLIVAGWLIHDCHRPIRWGLLNRETYSDITPHVTTFTRRDLQGCEDASMYIRQGFFAFIDGEWTGNRLQLTIGTFENPTQICLPVSIGHADEFSSYFPQSHQLFRFATTQSLSALSEADANAVADIIHQSIPIWMNEIPFFDGALHENVPAGLDHHITTQYGDCYVEGWINPLSNRNIKLSACLASVDSSVTLLLRSAFRRPDIAGADEFCGFAFVGRARLTAHRAPTVLLQTHFQDTDEVSYAKINLTNVDPAKFATVFWSRVLDTHSVNPEALRRILSFTRRAAVPIHDEPQNGRKGGNSREEVDALIMQNDDNSPLRNLAVLTLRLADAQFAKVMMLSPNPAPPEVWWPSKDKVLIVRPCRSIHEVLARAGDGFLLIMEDSSLTTEGFMSDVRAAAKMLGENKDMAGVVLAGKELTSNHKLHDHLSIEVKTAERQAPLWLNMCKGSALPPVLVRASALRDYFKQAWPQPTHALAVRSFLKSINKMILWLETASVEIFYARANVPGLSNEQADLLYQIDARL